MTPQGYRILQDKKGPWAIIIERNVFASDDFASSDLKGAEIAFIDDILSKHNLKRDRHEDAVGTRSIRVRVLPL